MPILSLRSELNLHTRCENQVTNEIDRRPNRAGDSFEMEGYRRRYPRCQHRPVGPSRKYNCHGLTFASRRTWIWDPAEIKKIVLDDDYENIPPSEVLAGDTVIYYSEGDAEHSGLVISVDELGPKILSKWGAAHEVIHRVRECPYDGSIVSYYRIKT